MKKEIFVEMKEAPLVLNESLKLTNFWLISVHKNSAVQLSKMAENIPYRLEKVRCFFKQVHVSSLCLCEVCGCWCLTCGSVVSSPIYWFPVLLYICPLCQVFLLSLFKSGFS